MNQEKSCYSDERTPRRYLENHVQIIIFTNDFFQFDDIGVTDLLQRLQIDMS